ncbi:unnamed protein product, partial [Ectocarpus sp. 12 AP-2014]
LLLLSPNSSLQDPPSRGRLRITAVSRTVGRKPPAAAGVDAPHAAAPTTTGRSVPNIRYGGGGAFAFTVKAGTSLPTVRGCPRQTPRPAVDDASTIVTDR